MKKFLTLSVFLLFSQYTIVFTNELQHFTPSNTSSAFCNGHINTIFKDGGNIWLGTDYGISKYDGEKWKLYTLPGRDNGIENEIISIAKDNEGNLWLVSRYRTMKFDGTTWTPFYDSYKVKSIIIDSKGTKWINSNEGLLKDEGTTGKIFFEKDTIYTMALDIQENIWLCTNQGIYKIRDDSTFLMYKIKGSKKSTLITDLMGDIWFGCEKLYKYDRKEWTSYDLNLNPVDSITSIAVDKNNILWFTTSTDLFSFDGKNIVLQKKIIENKINSITALSIDNNYKWIGTRQGLYQFNDTIYQYYESNGLASDYVFSMFEDSKGSIWAGSFHGLSLYKNGKWKSYTQENGLLSNWVRSIAEDKKGNIWLALSDGVSKLENGTFTNYNSFYGFNPTIAKIDSAGNIYIGSRYIFKLNGEQWEKPYGLFWVEYMAFDKNNNLWCVYYDDGYEPDKSISLLARIEGNTVKKINYADGLPESEITYMTSDHSGNIWLLTSDSWLVKYDGNSWYKIKLKLPYLRKMDFDTDGNIWLIGYGYNNLVKVTKDSIYTYSLNNSIWIENLFIDSNNTKWLETENGLYCFKDFPDLAITSVKKTKIENSISAYPNPVINNLTIDNLQPGSIISIYDMNGKRVFYKNSMLQTENINVSELRKGTYILKIIKKDNINTLKIIK